MDFDYTLTLMTATHEQMMDILRYIINMRVNFQSRFEVRNTVMDINMDAAQAEKLAKDCLRGKGIVYDLIRNV